MNISVSHSFFFTTLLLVFTAVGCEQEQPKQAMSRGERLAEAFCGCSTELLQLNKTAEVMLPDTSQQLQLKALMAQINTEYEKTKNCSSELLSRYGRLNTQDSATFHEAFPKKCPELARQKDLVIELLGH